MDGLRCPPKRLTTTLSIQVGPRDGALVSLCGSDLPGHVDLSTTGVVDATLLHATSLLNAMSNFGAVSQLDLVLVALAGLLAGAINTAVGSGSLITFPLLLALGVPPVTANVSNTMGLVGGGLGGVYGYRRELRGQNRTLTYLVAATLCGGIVGALALIALPAEVFSVIVPYLIALALLLVVAGPTVQRLLRSRRRDGSTASMAWFTGTGLATLISIFGCGVYGGYFGAAQGIMVFSVLSILLPVSDQVANGFKNVTVTATNLVAAMFFLLFARDHISWPIVAVIAVASTLGGVAGASLARRLSPTMLRLVIVVVGVAALVKFVTGGTS